jgi:hypothetical protein
MSSWDTGSKPGLCVSDPDTTCDGYVFTKRRPDALSNQLMVRAA